MRIGVERVLVALGKAEAALHRGPAAAATQSSKAAGHRSAGRRLLSMVIMRWLSLSDNDSAGTSRITRLVPVSDTARAGMNDRPH